MKTVAFFNNKGGVGKTSLTYHLAWMFSELGVRVIAADLDPQSNLTAAFLPDERLEELWKGEEDTILGAVKPLIDKLGDIKEPHVEEVGEIGLIAGDLGLSVFEDRLAAAWPACLDEDSANAHDAFRVMTSFYRIIMRAARRHGADLALIDVGPNLGALNRAALVSADYVVTPLAADLFSLRGLRNLGPSLRKWRDGWMKRTQGNTPPGIEMPEGGMRPIGYVVLQHAAFRGRPLQAYQRWMDRIPDTYHEQILHQPFVKPDAGSDPQMLSRLRNYSSLMSMALEARKPIFKLRPADGAIGGQAAAVNESWMDFEQLARRIAALCGVDMP